MNRPRNPRYFPATKVRGGRRKRIAPFQRLAGTFDRMGRAAAHAATAMRGILEGGIR